jgi:hypothetical protein
MLSPSSRLPNPPTPRDRQSFLKRNDRLVERNNGILCAHRVRAASGDDTKTPPQRVASDAAKTALLAEP